MHRAKLEGQRLGRVPLDIDHEALVRDRLNGMSLTAVQRSTCAVVRPLFGSAGRHNVVNPN